MSQTKLVEKIKTHFTFNTFPVETLSVYGIVWSQTGYR